MFGGNDVEQFFSFSMDTWVGVGLGFLWALIKYVLR
jgi:hypothetical protein